MNARLPVYAGPTCNPCADAERWSNEQEAADELAQAEERQASLIVLAYLQAIKQPSGWFNRILPGGPRVSPFKLLKDALENDDEARNAIAVLLAGPVDMKAALKDVHECLGVFHAKGFASEIVEEGARA
ncbi:MAG: hypothetical protein LBJ15_02525 [Comamonas sp.]|jgi:hypothetical protein|uniref:hypothetical protein n=1 Tax=Comamonas sp. TaxID=34028 RepID=UPI002822B0A3|nr:hypothetical protein [Comamonas sp.]MDR0212863.1 hypothetical protein [Comamonas sp.]